MHVAVRSRWLALAAIGVALTFFSGCQIDKGATGSTGPLTHVTIKPDRNLHAAPEGYIYQLWILSISTRFVFDPEGDSIIVLPPELSAPAPVVKFNWDPYLYAASDEQGNYLPVTLANGMDLGGLDVAPYFRDPVTDESFTSIGFITLEPVNDPDPLAPSGPTLMALNIDPQSHIGRLINPFALLELFGLRPSASYSLLSQSDKTGVPGARWRDNETEGQGIWFVNPRLRDRTVVDSLDAWDTYIKTFVPEEADPFNYVVWIHRVHPESSFSNFGLIYQEREPDFDFRDGFRDHAPGRFGPSDLIPGSPPTPGVQLGEDPVIIDGKTVGYRYITTSACGDNAVCIDTCIVRVDNPALTHCNRDDFLDPKDPRDIKFDSLEFDETSVLYTAYRTTGGDSTQMGQSLVGVVDLGDPKALAELPDGSGFLFVGWEYEAWLVFTKDSGIKPMSLGRFKSPSKRDSGDPYTIASNYDEHFHFPGEDFLTNLSSHDPSLVPPLNVLTDPRAEKIWITIEPDDDFGFDWAPDEPNTQLIYLSGFLPDDVDTNTAQPAYFPLISRDINPGPTGLNEGNFFPMVTIQFLPDPVE